MEQAQAVLIPIDNDSEFIYLNKSEFSIGRAINNSYVSKDLTVSRCHCVFKFENNKWTITDKSTNGTKVNSRSITKHNSHFLENNDIIELTEVIKYKFCYPFNIIENVSSKKRRLDENVLSIQSIPNTSNHLSEKSSIPLGQQEINSNSIISNQSEVHELKDKLCKEKAIIKKLKDDSKEMQSKIFGLEVDLFNKIASSVKLEQEIIDLKSSCANLEKEREELQLQLTEFESETNLLKQRLEKSQALDKIKPQNDDTEDEDKNLLRCVLRAEINERECSLKLKMNKAITQLRSLNSSETSIQQIQNYLTEVQTDIDELTSKRNELDNSIKTVEPPVVSASAEKITEDLFNTMETDLQCTICNELFIKSTSLNCGHTFCKMCIQQWRKQKNTCPVCRVSIKSSVPCIALDNYVDQTMEFLSPSKKETRAKLKETHEASTSNLNKNEGPRRTIYISLDSDSDDESILDEDTEDLSDYSDNYYGGYGSCFICGHPDHWANACPQRRRRR